MWQQEFHIFCCGVARLLGWPYMQYYLLYRPWATVCVFMILLLGGFDGL
jgi:hypothetical protein